MVLNDFEQRRAALERAREQTFRKIGQLHEKVLSRIAPLRQSGGPPELFFWPGQALGKLRIIDGPRTVVIVTDGISDPWDRTIHPRAPEWTFDFEVAVEVPKQAMPELSQGLEAAIAASWAPALLWALTDWIVAERHDLKGRLLKFACLTAAVPPVAGLRSFVSANGYMGVLLGIPFVGDRTGAQAVLAPLENGEAVWLLTAKLLTPDEYEWAIGVNDSSRAVALAEAFLRTDGPLSWLERKSILSRV